MSETSGIRAEIDAANAEFMARFNRGDMAAVARCYTEDGQVLAPSLEPFIGRAAIEAVMTGLRGDGGSVALETLEVESQGDTASEVGRYTLKGGDGQVRDRGKYIVLWKRVDGAWRLHRDMLSSNQPAS